MSYPRVFLKKFIHMHLFTFIVYMCCVFFDKWDQMRRLTCQALKVTTPILTARETLKTLNKLEINNSSQIYAISEVTGRAAAAAAGETGQWRAPEFPGAEATGASTVCFSPVHPGWFLSKIVRHVKDKETQFEDTDCNHS